MWKARLCRHYNAFTHPIVIIYIGILILFSYFILPQTSLPEIVTRQFSHVTKLKNLDLEAKAVLVFDDREGRILYEKNSHDPLPIASITKLMTVQCALDSLSDNKLVVVPDTVFAYNDNSEPVDGYESWSIKNLAIYTLIESSNEGAEELARAMGGTDEAVSCMNAKAIELGLSDTVFFNETGLDVDLTHAGAYSSARDVVQMMKQVFTDYPDVVTKTSYVNYLVYSRNGIIHSAQNTNKISNQIVGIVASKTGHTALAGGNLVYVMNASLQHNIYVVILGSTIEGRFTDALKINDAIIKSFAQ